MVFANIARGAYFKYYDREGSLVPAKYPHLRRHEIAGEGPGPDADEEAAVTYSCCLVRMLFPYSPAVPIPYTGGRR